MSLLGLFVVTHCHSCHSVISRPTIFLSRSYSFDPFLKLSPAAIIETDAESSVSRSTLVAWSAIANIVIARQTDLADQGAA